MKFAEIHRIFRRAKPYNLSMNATITIENLLQVTPLVSKVQSDSESDEIKQLRKSFVVNMKHMKTQFEKYITSGGSHNCLSLDDFWNSYFSISVKIAVKMEQPIDIADEVNGSDSSDSESGCSTANPRKNCAQIVTEIKSEDPFDISDEVGDSDSIDSSSVYASNDFNADADVDK